MRRWQKFERLTEKIMQDLAPHAQIKWDDHILGEDSEILRQIDVSVRWKDGDDEHLLIIDAKDWSKPADVGDIEKFAGMVKDVRAGRGILVCNAGFSRAAHTYAANLGVGLCNLHDAESRGWARDLTIPIVWIELTPQVRVSTETWLNVGDQVQSDERFPFVLSLGDSSADEVSFPYAKLDVIGTFARVWNAGEIPRTVGERHEICEERSLRALVRDVAGTMRWRPLRRFSIYYTVVQASWLGQFCPSQCRGLIDYLDSKAFVASYLPIEELPVRRDESWDAIGDPNKVALSVRGTVVTTACFQIIDGTTGDVSDLRFEFIKASTQP
jgi:hypothetical protein